MAKHAKTKKKSKVALVVPLIICILLIAAVAFVLIMRPTFAKPLLDVITPQSSGPSSVESSSSAESSFADVGDATADESQEASGQAKWDESNRIPYIASLGEINLNSPIAPASLTGILFHQASGNYALVLETDLPEADYEEVADARQMRINHDQVSGTWLDAEALHLWRTSSVTDMDTCIDVGAAAGTPVHAPVTGTVVLIRDYVLEDTVDDIEIHIQPDGYPEVDCVLIHTTDPCVKAGDHVEGGVTVVSYVRDIEKDLVDVQLGFFTPEGVGGNHTHLQLNDASDETYRKTRLEGAIKVK